MSLNYLYKKNQLFDENLAIVNSSNQVVYNRSNIDLNEDDIRLLDRVSDWIMAADEKYITKFSAFLDERQCLLCEKLMASVKYENYRLWGGYENAARRMLCVYPEYGEAESEDTICPLVSGSKLPVGSSASINLGLFRRARAITIRCCSPPDSSCGIL